MTAVRRIRMKKFKGPGLALLVGLVLLVFFKAGCTPNINNELKSFDKPSASDIDPGYPAADCEARAQNLGMVPDEVLVKFSPDAQPQALQRIQAELQLETIRKFHSPNLFLMKITDGTPVEAIIRKLKAYRDVEYAEPNYAVKANP